jgi:glycosyltransferase involved in cell wall biosynthesis
VILYVGTIEPRKNLPMLIEAFARRRQAGELPHQLVCAGPYGWLSSDLQQLIDRWQVRDAVRITGYVPFEDLPAIYTLSEVFVYPSVYEGFGLPVVEALACGTPTLIAPIPALIEVAGGAAARMPSNDVESLGDTLVALTGNREWRDDLSRMALERAGQFSWRRAARETLAVYRHVVHGRRTTVHSPSSSRTDKTPASGPPAAAARTSQQP